MDLSLTDPGLIAKNFTCHVSRWLCQELYRANITPMPTLHMVMSQVSIEWPTAWCKYTFLSAWPHLIPICKESGWAVQKVACVPQLIKLFLPHCLTMCTAFGN